MCAFLVEAILIGKNLQRAADCRLCWAWAERCRAKSQLSGQKQPPRVCELGPLPIRRDLVVLLDGQIFYKGLSVS